MTSSESKFGQQKSNKKGFSGSELAVMLHNFLGLTFPEVDSCLPEKKTPSAASSFGHVITSQNETHLFVEVV